VRHRRSHPLARNPRPAETSVFKTKGNIGVQREGKRSCVIVALSLLPAALPTLDCAVPVVARRLEELRSTSSHNRDADLIREACNDRATTVPSKGEESAPLRTRYDVLLDLGLSAGLRRRRWDCRGHGTAVPVR
jgi:hypothetical protein